MAKMHEIDIRRTNKIKLHDPKDRDNLCFVDLDGNVVEIFFEKSSFCYRLLKRNHAFLNREHAKYVDNKHLVLRKLEIFAYHLNESIFMAPPLRTLHYAVSYNPQKDELTPCVMQGLIALGVPYFSTFENCQRAIDSLTKEEKSVLTSS